MYKKKRFVVRCKPSYFVSLGEATGEVLQSCSEQAARHGAQGGPVNAGTRGYVGRGFETCVQVCARQ